MSDEMPCPFCDGDNVAVIHSDSPMSNYAICYTCGATGPKCATWLRAQDRWEEAPRRAVSSDRSAPDALTLLLRARMMIAEAAPGAFHNGVTGPNGCEEGDVWAGLLVQDIDALLAKQGTTNVTSQEPRT